MCWHAGLQAATAAATLTLPATTWRHFSDRSNTLDVDSKTSRGSSPIANTSGSCALLLLIQTTLTGDMNRHAAQRKKERSEGIWQSHVC
jgi:hypothetical protein